YHTFLTLTRRPPRSTPFPYTTLFRSDLRRLHQSWNVHQWYSSLWQSLHGLRVTMPLKTCQQNQSASRFPKYLRRHLRQSSCLSRSEEHTSELQSRENLVCRLLLEKKK